MKPPRKPKVALARQMRKALTPPEFLLWERLKTRDESGFMFRRQHPMGPYILDFYCAQAKLAIEVDGSLHSLEDRPERDAARDSWLMKKRIRVYRIPAAEVFKDPDGVADGIRLLALERAREKKARHPTTAIMKPRSLHDRGPPPQKRRRFQGGIRHRNLATTILYPPKHLCLGGNRSRLREPEGGILTAICEIHTEKISVLIL